MRDVYIGCLRYHQALEHELYSIQLASMFLDMARLVPFSPYSASKNEKLPQYPFLANSSITNVSLSLQEPGFTMYSLA